MSPKKKNPGKRVSRKIITVGREEREKGQFLFPCKVLSFSSSPSRYLTSGKRAEEKKLEAKKYKKTSTHTIPEVISKPTDHQD